MLATRIDESITIQQNKTFAFKNGNECAKEHKYIEAYYSDNEI